MRVRYDRDPWGLGSCLTGSGPSPQVFRGQQRERGAAFSSPSPCSSLMPWQRPRWRYQRLAPQKRCISHLTIIFMPGGALTPPVSMPCLYSCGERISTVCCGHPEDFLQIPVCRCLGRVQPGCTVKMSFPNRRPQFYGLLPAALCAASTMAVVEYPGTMGIDTTRPPAASTSSRPTIWSSM